MGRAEAPKSLSSPKGGERTSVKKQLFPDGILYISSRGFPLSGHQQQQYRVIIRNTPSAVTDSQVTACFIASLSPAFPLVFPRHSRSTHIPVLYTAYRYHAFCFPFNSGVDDEYNRFRVGKVHGGHCRRGEKNTS